MSDPGLVCPIYGSNHSHPGHISNRVISLIFWVLSHGHTSGLGSSFSLHTLFPVDISLRVCLGILVHFPTTFWANCSTSWFYLFIYLFIFIRVYLIYHVVIQVYSKVIQLYIYMYLGFAFGSVVKESPYNEWDLGSIPGLERYAQRDMTSLSRILAWRISWTEEPSRLPSIGSQRVGHIRIPWACTGTHPYIYSFTNSFFFYIVTEFLAGLPVVL